MGIVYSQSGTMTVASPRTSAVFCGISFICGHEPVVCARFNVRNLHAVAIFADLAADISAWGRRSGLIGRIFRACGFFLGRGKIHQQESY